MNPPDEFSIETSCCFSGHRKLSRSDYEEVSDRICRLMTDLYEKGIRTCYVGGALGFDYVAAVTLANLKNNMPELKLVIALPCPEYDNKWDERDRALYRHVFARADKIVYVSDKYRANSMQMRNRYMVDRSCYCICWLTERAGGTMNTVKYANDCGLEIFNLANGDF